MMDCFNEGFTENETVDAVYHVPKVFLNFTKAHMYPIEPIEEETSGMLSARNTSPKRSEEPNSFETTWV